MSRDLGGGPGRAIEWVRHTGIRARNGVLHAAGRNLPEESPSPRLQVWARDKARLYRYLPTQEPAEIRATPILFVMSLVTTAKVFDLQEDNSLVRRFLDAGHDVYLLDWGVPDAVESRNTLETYCDEYIPRAVRAVMDESGSEDVNIFGYCLGAIFTMLSVAGHKAMPVRNIVMLATPVDMGELGPLTAMLRGGQLNADDLVDWTGNVPSDRIKESFHLVEPAGEITTYLSLWNSLGHPEQLEAHQALVRWSSGHIPFPGAAFRQIVDLFIHDDSLVRGKVPLGNRVVDLADITVPVLSVTGARDKLVPAPSTDPLTLPGAELEKLELNAGHAGLIVGRRAHKEMIPTMLQWLDDRSGSEGRAGFSGGDPAS